MKRIISIIIGVVMCLFTGFMAGMMQTESLEEWYPFLIKSPLTPPSYVFPIAWIILYICMGVSAGIIVSLQDKPRKFLMYLFVGQLALNFIWSFLFFYLMNPLLGLIDIILLDILVMWYVLRSYRVSVLSSILCWPYIAWLLFATYLNGYIVFNN